jgi:hypothetical protein
MQLAGPLPTTSIDTFSDRALLLIGFLLERHGQLANMRRCEQDVADWIVGWRRKEKAAADVQQHFASTELGIILRTLNGPNQTGPRFEESANQQLCWVIARCLSQQA